MNEILLALTAIAILGGWLYTMNGKEKEYAAERNSWHVERQQLLDRIQAGSFAEYKTQEVRMVKAQSNVQEHPKLEQL